VECIGVHGCVHALLITSVGGEDTEDLTIKANLRVKSGLAEYLTNIKY
jgi:hypothetical protein